MTGVVHDDLAGKNLPPGRHYLDSGYLSAALVVSGLAQHGIALIGPLLADTSAQARLDHVYMACALNLLRLQAYWTGTPLDRRRTSHLARLELGLAA